MSCVRRGVELSAPVGKPTQEAFTIGGFRCNYCCGNGWFWKESEFGSPYKDPCPMCGGSGLMKARVTVAWVREVKSEERKTKN